MNDEMEITELAIAYWRLKRWIDKAEVDKKLSAYSAIRKIEKYMAGQGVQFIIYDQQTYDIGLPISVVDDSEIYDCDNAVIDQTIEPTILYNEKIIHYGKVVLKKENNI